MMAEDKKILEAPKKVVDGLVEVFEGLAQTVSYTHLTLPTKLEV